MEETIEPDGVQPDQRLPGAGLADGLPFPHARGAALRGRSAEAAVDPAWGSAGRDRGDRRTNQRRDMSEPTIKFTLDGDVGVITLDNGDLNLFGPDASTASTRHRRARDLGRPRRGLARRGRHLQRRRRRPRLRRRGRAGRRLPVADGTQQAAGVAADPDARALPRPVPDGRAGDRARLRHALGRGVGASSASSSASSGSRPGAGGTQRIAERAGPARAREFVMTGGLYDAATLERWHVVNRVVADDAPAGEGDEVRPRAGCGPDRRARDDEADRPRLP